MDESVVDPSGAIGLASKTDQKVSGRGRINLYKAFQKVLVVSAWRTFDDQLELVKIIIKNIDQSGKSHICIFSVICFPDSLIQMIKAI